MEIEQMRHGVLLVLLVVSAYTDVAQGKIWNRLTYPAMLLGGALQFASGGWAGAGLTGGDGHGYAAMLPAQGESCLVNALLGWGLGTGLFFLFYLMGGMGGGDVKLMGAVGALGGWGFCLWALVYTSLVGAFLAAGVVLWRGRSWKGIREGMKGTIPYGVAISAGTMWAWWVVYVR
jgi:prepilin peptidase CpaA